MLFLQRKKNNISTELLNIDNGPTLFIKYWQLTMQRTKNYLEIWTFLKASKKFVEVGVFPSSHNYLIARNSFSPSYAKNPIKKHAVEGKHF